MASADSGQFGKVSYDNCTTDEHSDDVIAKDDLIDDVADEENVLYGIDENPPIILCLFLGLQHYLTAFGSTLSVPLVLAGPLCVGSDDVGLGQLITTMFFTSGITTILQVSFGVRLPIVQGATFAFLVPTVSILSQPEWACPSNLTVVANCSMTSSNNETGACSPAEPLWYSRIREIQGAVCVASLFQILVGCSGLLSVFLRYVGPLTIAPSITLIGLSLFEVAADKAAAHWWIAVATMFLIALFSQYLKHVTIPFPVIRARKFAVVQVPIFKMFPVLLAMVLSWLLCLVLTLTGALPSDPKAWGYFARTDVRTSVLDESPWFRVPYPGQWGVPTVSAGAVVGMLAGVFASMMESVGDYYACARMAKAPPPPPSAVNRGIAMEGIGCVIAGLMGTGNGTTSYSENVGAIGITKVASRRVMLVTGFLLIILGMFGKIGALFVTIPEPVVGGMFISMFGMITAVGISNLHFCDLTSTRNLFCLAAAIFFGLCFPHWMARNPGAVNTGVTTLDQTITVLLSTSMFVGGVVGFLLDITLPGTPKERGILTWRADVSRVKGDSTSTAELYAVPGLQKVINRSRLLRRLPVFSSTRTDDVSTEKELTKAKMAASAV